VAKKSVAKPIGLVIHFYGNIKVAVVKFKKSVKVGAKIEFRGATTNFSQDIKSMQFDHKDIKVAPKGKQVGMKVSKRVREGDEIYEIK
jgi:translation elongation factor EF-1alpha